MITIRTFGPRFQTELLALWRAALPLDPISDHRFCTQILLDRNFDPDGLLLAFDDANLIGAAGAVVSSSPPHSDAGWIRFFFVAPFARRQGLGTRLLTAAIHWLRSKGVERIRFSDNLPTYITPGLNGERYPVASTMLRKRGFVTVGRAQAMARSLSGDHTSPGLAELGCRLDANGYRFRSPKIDDLLPLVELAQRTFSDDWADLIRSVAYHHNPAEQIVVAIDPSHAVVGWAMFGSYPDTPSRFGPFGVSPTQRGKGVGAILLDRTLDAMRRAGLTDAWFLWVEPDSPAEQLYLRAGFEIRERYEILELQSATGPPNSGRRKGHRPFGQRPQATT